VYSHLCFVLITDWSLVISGEVTCKTGHMSISAVSTVLKPEGSKTAGPMSMNLIVYIVWVGGQNFLEAE